jgi:hypothetical protein
MFERLIKRTIFIAECKCGERDVKTENPPRERKCHCGEWVRYEPQEWIGQDFAGVPYKDQPFAGKKW